MTGETTIATDRPLLDESRQTRTMRWIMAIMLFLTVLAGAMGLGTLNAAHLLDRQLAGRLTVQIVEADPNARAADAKRILAALQAMPGVAHASEVSHAQLVALLRPWLGDSATDPDLPVPAMIDVDLRDGDDTAAGNVATVVHHVTASARVDRHARWMSPVSSFMDVLIWLGGGVVLLLAGATAAVVILAARAGLEMHSGTIDVMHMLGSTDVQVARLFQRRIARDTLVGGVIGTLAAAAVAGFVGLKMASLGSDLLGGVALAERDWLLLALLPVAFALLATIAARFAVLRALGKTL